MDKDTTAELMFQFSNVVPSDKLGYLKNRLEKAPDESYENIAMTKTKSPIVVLIFSIILGWLGVDRFIIGDVGLGVCKLLFGGVTFGIWWLIDIFLTYNKCKEKNLQNIIMCL